MVLLFPHSHMHIIYIYFYICRYIASVNRKSLSYKLAVNHMADYSEKELHMMRGVYKNSNSPRGNLYIPFSSREDVPSSCNWWLKGTMYMNMY